MMQPSSLSSGASMGPREPPLLGAGFDLEALFRAEWLRLVRVATLLVGDLAAAEELVQEAFVRTYQASHRLRSASAAPAYLRSTVVNLAHSRFRRERIARRRRPPMDLAGASPEDIVVLREDHRELLDALNQLPNRQRECVILRYYVDLSEAEIAETLGISTGAVKSHSHRALATLESILEARR